MKTLKNFTIDNAYSDIRQAQETLEGAITEGAAADNLDQAKDFLERARLLVATYLRAEADRRAMENYEKDLLHHNEFWEAKKPNRDHYEDRLQYERDMSAWHRGYHMDAPNKPGYYRANND